MNADLTKRQREVLIGLILVHQNVLIKERGICKQFNETKLSMLKY